jgi:putative tryptophan/tyrosine transport system substrate-binding protein
MLDLRRREFITLLGGAAAAWPVGVRAQQAERVRRIGVLMHLPESDPEAQARIRALLGGLQQLGWTEGRNLRIEYRFGAADVDRARRYAAELIALAPDVIQASGTGPMAAVHEATRTVPIVFAQVPDPVNAGFVDNLARPGGNATGFSVFEEYGSSAKWLELLKEIAPQVTRVAVLRDPTIAAGIGQTGAIQSVAPSLGVQVSPVGVRDASEIERTIATFGHGTNGGLIVLGAPLAIMQRDLISTLAARHRLPAIYPVRLFVVAGGLISYGPDSIDPYRRVAGYVDRILRGEKAADLPVQNPTKFELVINLKTATALGLDVPSTLLARADEVIE